MWNKITRTLAGAKAPFIWIADKWNKFELWVASIAPGVKTHLTALTLLVGNSAFELKDYISQLPIEVLSKYLTADFIIGLNLALITLIFWFRRLANKVD